MSEQADYPDPRASLIEDLLTRQEDVIQQLDDLEKKLIATIEEIRPPKEETAAAEETAEEVHISKAA